MFYEKLMVLSYSTAYLLWMLAAFVACKMFCKMIDEANEYFKRRLRKNYKLNKEK